MDVRFAIHGWTGAEQWREYKAPTLYLAGDREVFFPPREAISKLNALAPGIQTVLIPGAGHDFFLQRADEVNRRVLEFFIGRSERR